MFRGNSVTKEPDVGGRNRRSQRTRKVAQGLATVDEEAQQQAIQAHLNSLEEDHKFVEIQASDEEFNIESEEELEIKSNKRKRKVHRGRRTTRSAREKQGSKSFTAILDEAELDRVPKGTPTYLTAAAQPPKFTARRKFCSVCGNISPYSCTRCGMRYCCRRCYSVHTDTRCLKFIA